MLKRLCACALLFASIACGGSKTSSTPASPSPSPTPAPPPTTFTLSGSVTDTSSAAIGGARVAVADGPNAGRSTTTSGSGAYSLTGLQQSGMTVNVSADGYVTTAQGVTLTSNQTLNFRMTRLGPRTQFGAGQYVVNTDIAAGRYYSVPGSSCYWERQSGFGGSLAEILANDFVGYAANHYIVDILVSDRGFKTESACGTWFNTPRAGAQSDIRAGIWLVGSQVSAGTYRATVQSGCYWERLRDFTGNLSGIIANNFIASAGSQLVTISGGDAGFQSTAACGTWSRVSSSSPDGERASESTASVDLNRRAYRQRRGGAR
jgi:hypothetical protein